MHNTSSVAANETIVRSVPGPNLRFVPGTAELDGKPITIVDDNPFAHGAANTGLNIGTISPGATHRLSYVVEATSEALLSDDTIRTSYSSRESVSPTVANEVTAVPLDQLTDVIAQVDGVAGARQLSFADLGSNSLSTGETTVAGPAKIFGFNDAGTPSTTRPSTVVEGSLGQDGAVISAEAATALQIGLGDTISVVLPDNSTLELRVSGTADLSQARSLFSSRRGGDLETFVYTPNSVIVSPAIFAETVVPAYERAATTRGQRLKNPPVREIDIALERDLLNADPATALVETQQISADVAGIASNQDVVLDNISNTLNVAGADAATAKRLFVFLGVPGGFLAAMLAGYAGTVLADAQRREQATLRIRGASRRHLRRMLAIRTSLLTTVGALDRANPRIPRGVGDTRTRLPRSSQHREPGPFCAPRHPRRPCRHRAGPLHHRPPIDRPRNQRRPGTTIDSSRRSGGGQDSTSSRSRSWPSAPSIALQRNAFDGNRGFGLLRPIGRPQPHPAGAAPRGLDGR